MGVSTDAYLCYGIAYDEETQFPWNDVEDEDWEKWEGDFGWWASAVLELDTNELPVQDVIHCSYDEPMHILAVPGTVTCAFRGYPIEISSLEVDKGKERAFLDFLQEHKIDIPDGPRWWLCSVWG